MAIRIYLLIIYLNANALSALIKRHWVAERIKKKRGQPINMLPIRDSLHFEGHRMTKSEGVKKIFHANKSKQENKQKSTTLSLQYLYQTKEILVFPLKIGLIFFKLEMFCVSLQNHLQTKLSS